MQFPPWQLHVLKCNTREERLQANEPYRKDLSSRNPGIVERLDEHVMHGKGPGEGSFEFHSDSKNARCIGE